MITSSETLRGPAGFSLAHETVDLMSTLTVPPFPQNYEIWLSYMLGGHPDLRAVLEERMAKGLPFDDKTNESLYERFFSNIRLSAEMMATGEKIARELSDIVHALELAGNEANAYGDTLTTAASRLEEGMDEQRLREVVLSLATATLRMAQSNRSLNRQLDRSRGEMEQMRDALRQVRAEALTDSLTGLANRKMFDETLKRRLAEAAEQPGPVCLLLADIDHFKRFNDTWGHQTGDQIIRFVASSLQKNANHNHLVARYGGEEFAVMMPGTDLKMATQLAENLRAMIEKKKLRRKSTNEDLGVITISIGLALYRPKETPHSLIERADACLYASKRGGRNRVTTDAEMAAAQLQAGRAR